MYYSILRSRHQKNKKTRVQSPYPQPHQSFQNRLFHFDYFNLVKEYPIIVQFLLYL